ncbi:MAG TPA: molybdopterin converting factor subunit 1 [Burkholderiales bacterium]|nr:molybdopterin converting factor subunit 1 [Burkholderiales bacterium]
MIKLVFFARLREDLGVADEQLQLPEHVKTVDALRRHLIGRGGRWEEILAPNKSLRVAVNQEMAKGETTVQAGDEVAFFPPVTGG